MIKRTVRKAVAKKASLQTAVGLFSCYKQAAAGRRSSDSPTWEEEKSTSFSFSSALSSWPSVALWLAVYCEPFFCVGGLPLLNSFQII